MMTWMWVVAVLIGYLVWGWLCARFNLLGSERHDAEEKGMQILLGPPISLIFVFYGICMGIHWTCMQAVRLLGRTVPSR